MCKILVTGATGYIGRHFIAHAIKNKIPVRGFSRSKKPSEFRSVEWAYGDIRNMDDITKAVKDCSKVLHLACTSLLSSLNDPITDLEVNAGGTLNLLEVSRHFGIERIVYTSTCQIYGRQKRLPMMEDDLPRPESPYATSKLAGELYCQTYMRQNHLSGIILRLFNVYGNKMPGLCRNTVETIFLKQIQNRLPLEIDNTDDSRDFIHISDVLEALTRSLEPDVKVGVYNIGSGVEISIFELAKKMLDLTNAFNIPVNLKKSSREPYRMQAFTHKAQKELYFSTKISLEEGLGELMNHLNHQ